MRRAALPYSPVLPGNPFIFPASRSFLTTGSWIPPAFGDRIEVALRHLTLLSADIGERAACLEMRKQFCSYTKGFPGKTGEYGSAALRKRLSSAETIEDYRRILGEKR